MHSCIFLVYDKMFLANGTRTLDTNGANNAPRNPPCWMISFFLVTGVSSRMSFRNPPLYRKSRFFCSEVRGTLPLSTLVAHSHTLHTRSSPMESPPVSDSNFLLMLGCFAMHKSRGAWYPSLADTDGGDPVMPGTQLNQSTRTTLYIITPRCTKEPRGAKVGILKYWNIGCDCVKNKTVFHLERVKTANLLC